MGKSSKSIKKAKMALKEKQNVALNNKSITMQNKSVENKGTNLPTKKKGNSVSTNKNKNTSNSSTPMLTSVQKKKTNVQNQKQKNIQSTKSTNVSSPVLKQGKVENKDIKNKEAIKKQKITLEQKEVVKTNSVVKDKKEVPKTGVSKQIIDNKNSLKTSLKEKEKELEKPVVKRITQVHKDSLPQRSDKKNGIEPVKKNGQVVGQIKKKGSSVRNVGITHTTQIPIDKTGGSFELPKKKATVSAEDSMLKLANELKAESQKKKQKSSVPKKKSPSSVELTTQKKKEDSLEKKVKEFEKEVEKPIVPTIEEVPVSEEKKEEKKPTKRAEKYAYQAELAKQALEEEEEEYKEEELSSEETKIELPFVEEDIKEEKAQEEPSTFDLEEIPSALEEQDVEEVSPLEETQEIAPFEQPLSESKKEEEEEIPIEKIKLEDIEKTKKEKGKKQKKHLTKAGWIFKILAWISLLFFVSSTVHLFIRIIRINLIPIKYIYIAIAVISFISLLFLLFAIGRKKILHFFQILLSLLLGSVFTFGAFFIMKSDDTLKNLFSSEEDMTTYYVVTLKEKDLTSLDQLEDKIVGLMKQNSFKVKEKLGEKNYIYKEYDAVGALTNSLVLESEEKSEALIIDSNVYEALPELDNDLYEQLHVLYEFEMHVEKEDIQLEVEDTTIEQDPEEKEVYQGPKRNPNLLEGVNIGNSYIIYISGIDGGGNIRPYGLSDVNILVVVNPDTHRILLVSTPRDYFVQVAGTTGLKDKLTHAGLYGINASIGTMQNLYGIKINNYAKVTFGAIKTLVDDIGGIEVYSDTAFYSFHKKGWYVQKGMNYMDGTKALAYSRERYAYAGGDRHRIKNQQDVIAAIIKKVATDPQQLLKFNTILNDINPYFTTNISYDKMQQMVKEQLNTLKPWNVTSISVNGTNGRSATASWPNQVTYVMYPTESTIVDAQAKIVEVMTGA